MPGHQVVDKPVVGPLTTGPSQTFCPPAGGSAMTVWIPPLRRGERARQPRRGLPV